MNETALIVELDVLLEHQSFLRDLARALVREPSDADELVQEAYLAMLYRPPRGVRSVKSFLAGVVRNMAGRMRRREARLARREEAAARPERVPAAADLATQAETQREVLSAVLALAEPYRTTVLMRYFGGLRAAEIAAQSGVPASTVRSRLRRAQAQLKQTLMNRKNIWVGVLAFAAIGRTATAAPAVYTINKETPMPAPKLMLAIAGLAAGVALFVAVGSTQAGDDPVAPSPLEASANKSAPETSAPAALDDNAADAADAILSDTDADAESNADDVKVENDPGVVLRGKSMMGAEEMTKALSLTDEQVAEMKALAKKHTDDFEALMDMPTESGLSPREIGEKYKDAYKEAMKSGEAEKIMAVTKEAWAHHDQLIPGRAETWVEAQARLSKEYAEGFAAILTEEQRKLKDDWSHMSKFAKPVVIDGSKGATVIKSITKTKVDDKD